MSENQFQTLLKEIKLLKSEMNGRFDSVENRLDRVEKDLDKIETWFGYRADPHLPLVKRGVS